MGAVLLQKDEENRLVPIQWSSKKLTPTEMRYTISEKEMLAIIFGIYKFSYELRGRKFHLITDHRALEKIRIKPEFNNDRFNRYIEKIQYYDFTIEYKKGSELVEADALSRLYEKKNKRELEVRKGKNEKGKKIIEGKLKKHEFEIEGVGQQPDKLICLSN